MKKLKFTSMLSLIIDFAPVLKISPPLLILLFTLLISLTSSAEEPFYSISIGSHERISDAQKMVEELKLAGHRAFFREEHEDGKNVFVIYTERYPTKAAAEVEARVLKELDLIPDYIIRKINGKTEPAQDIEKIMPAKEDEINLRKEEDIQTTKREKIEPTQTTPEYPEKREIKGVSMRVAAFREKENADKLLDILQKEGYDAFYSYEQTGRGGDFYMMYLDGYETRTELIKEAENLKKSGIIADYIINPGMVNEQVVTAGKKIPEKEPVLLHIGSFQNQDNAEKAVLSLKERYLQAFWNEETVNNIKWYRVYIEGFADEEEAINTGEDLIGRGIISYFKPFISGKNKLKNSRNQE